MFIRAQPSKRKNAEAGTSYSLLQSQRKKGVSKHKTLLNLGPDFSIPKDEWKDLIRQVTARLKEDPLPPLEGKSKAFREAVDDITKRLLDQGFDIFAKRAPESIKVFPDQIEHTDSRTVAGERLIMEAMNELKLPRIFRDLGVREEENKLALALVVGRMLAPGSELAAHKWMAEYSSILDILECTLPHHNTLYNVSGLFHEFKEEIIDALYQNTRNALNFDETIIFYDLTNTFYHGEEKGELLRRGYSKQKRNDCPLVSLALTLCASGFPRNVQILPGSAGEPATLKTAIETLKGDTSTVIMDAGIATKENRACLREKGLDYVCVEHTKTPPVLTWDPDQEFSTAGKKKIRAWRLPDEKTKEDADSEGPKEQRVYVHSEARQFTGESIFRTNCEKFEAEIKKVIKGLSTPVCLEDHEKILAKVGRLMEKFKVGHLYDIQTTTRPGSRKGQLYTATLTFIRKEAHEQTWLASGGYVLRTSHADWPVKEVAKLYWRLTEIERVFRIMKSDLGLRPVFHSREDRTIAHLMITIIAYHVSHLVRTKLKRADMHHSWDTIRKNLNKVKRITTELPMSQTRVLELKLDQNLPPLLQEIFHILRYEYDPGAIQTKQERTRQKKVPQKPPDS